MKSAWTTGTEVGGTPEETEAEIGVDVVAVAGSGDEAAAPKRLSASILGKIWMTVDDDSNSGGPRRPPTKLRVLTRTSVRSIDWNNELSDYIPTMTSMEKNGRWVRYENI